MKTWPVIFLCAAAAVLATAADDFRAVLKDVRKWFNFMDIEFPDAAGDFTERDTTDYWSIRNSIAERGLVKQFGWRVTLNEQEEAVSRIFTAAKQEETEKSVIYPATYDPSQNFTLYKEVMETSKMFKLLKSLPKGGNLRAKFHASASLDYLFSLTYLDDLYMCIEEDVLKLKFSADQPKGSCEWVLLNDLRKAAKDIDTFDANLKLKLTSGYDTFYTKDFLQLIDQYAIIPLISYKPVFKNYLYRTLQEMHEDNVIYVEFRYFPTTIYNLDGSTYNSSEAFNMISEVLGAFKVTHPDFIGAKFIYCGRLGEKKENLIEMRDELMQLREEFPELIAGFDLIGNEDIPYSWSSVLDVLLTFPKNIPFICTAGETRSWGAPGDYNILDAVQLGCKRLGGALALSKHPVFQERAKKEGIAVELYPVSQSLTLVGNPHFHPLLNLIASDFPLVLTSDQSTYWNYRGVTSDWYTFFVSMTSRQTDLRVLKNLGLNSIIFSTMKQPEKAKALQKWIKQWDNFVSGMKQRAKNKT